MLTRSFAAAALSCIFFACATPYSAVDDGSDGAKADVAANPSALDGTWDITSDALKPSQVTIDGNSIVGLLVFPVPDGDFQELCTLTQHHAKFTFTITGSDVKGTVDESYSYQGGGCSDRHAISHVTGWRSPTATGATPTGATPYEGEWGFQIGDADPSIGISIAGFLAKLWTETSGSETSPLVSTTVKGAGAMGLDANNLQAFAARKR